MHNDAHSHPGQKRSRIVELAGLALRPGIQFRGIDQDLPVRRKFHVRAIHGPRSGSFEVDSFIVIATAVARTFEFVFAGLPVGRATEMRAARIDYEYAVRRAIHPDAIFLLELRVDTKRKFRGISNLEN